MNRFADDESDFLAGDLERGSFFHAVRHDTQRMQRAWRAGDGESGRFDTNVVGTGGAAADAESAVLFHASVIGGAARDGEVEILASAERLRSALFREPRGEGVADAFLEGGRLEHAAVEEQVGGTAGGLAFGGLFDEEAGEVAADRGVGFVGEAELFEAGGGAADRFVGDGASGEESFGEGAVDEVAGEIDADRTAYDARTAAENRHRMGVGSAGGEERFFGGATGVPKRDGLPGVEFVALLSEQRLRGEGEGEVHVVAADEDVIPHGEAV